MLYRGWKTPGRLRGDKEEAVLKQAGEDGYVYLSGSDACGERLCRAWLLECKRHAIPFVSLQRCDYRYQRRFAFLLVRMIGDWFVTPKLLEKVQYEVRGDEEVWRDGDSLRWSGLSVKEMHSRAKEIVALVLSCQPDKKDGFTQLPRLIEGSCKCLDAFGFEDDLVEGEIYFIREIATMRGHVVVFIPGRSPVVGIHAERFEYDGLTLKPLSPH